MKYAKLLGMLLVLAMLVAACGGGETTDTTGEAGTTGEAETTGETETTGSEPETFELTQSVTSNNGVTVNYPEGWAEPIAQIGIFVYTSTAAERVVTFYSMPEGELYLQINTTPVSAERTLTETWTYLFTPLGTEMDVTLGEPEVVQIDGRDVAVATGTNDRVGIYAAVIDASEDTYITFIAYANNAELEEQLPLIEAILATATYAAP